MFKVCPANKSESRNILLISAAFLLINFMNFLYPSVELIKYFLNDTGLFTHPDSACVMLNLTGIPCAFCGLSRSLIARINLDVSGALYYNPSSVVFCCACFKRTKDCNNKLENIRDYIACHFNITLVS